jgi:glucan biosynthesis protein C
VAGFFAALVIARRGPQALMRQRLRRVVVPFVVTWPLVFLALSAATAWAAIHVEHPSAMLLLIRQWMETPDAPSLPPSTGHLWFLYYLLLFTVLHWVVRTLELARLGELMLASSPVWLLVVLPLLLIPALASVSAPHPAPESLLPQFWAIGFYGSFFALGALLHGQPDWLDRTRPFAPWMLTACVLLYAVFLWRIGAEPPGAAQPTASWLVASLEACLSVWLTLVCLQFGQRLLNRPQPVLRYLSQSAYWTYLLHLPLLFLLQYWLMDFELDWWLKLVLATGATLAACLISYQLLVRHTPLRRFVG